MARKNLPETEVTHFTVTLVYGDVIKDVLLDVETIINCEDVECAQELLEACLSEVESKALGPLKAIEITILPRGKALIYRFDKREVLLILHRKDVDVRSIVRNITSLQ